MPPPRLTGAAQPPPPLPSRPTPPSAGAETPAAPQRGIVVRVGVVAWALVGIVLAAAGVALATGRLSIIVVPFVLALFPAALLHPVSDWLMAQRVPPAIASLLTILGFLGILTGAGALIVPPVLAEGPDIIRQVETGVAQLQELVDEGVPFIEEGTDLIGVAQDQAVSFLREQGTDIASSVVDGVAGIAFAFVGLFFYLKDGRTIFGWVVGLFPRASRESVVEIGGASWATLGGYFRGQLLVALVDAVFIGLGLWVLGVPLVVPLAVLVFFGGLFPIVGAFVSGAVAVLVALATQGFGIALGALAVVVAVQQLESNILAPIVLGRATKLHPLAVLTSLSAGGVLLGILGAFLAVPVAASVARAGSLLRRRHAPHDVLSADDATAGTNPSPAGTTGD